MRSAARVLAAAAGVVAAVLAGSVPPAWAAAPDVEWRTPTPGHRFAMSGFTLDATVKMEGDGATLRGNATLSFSSPEGHPVPAPTDHPTDNQASKVVTQAVSFPWNGPYTARITAVGRDGTLDRTDETGDRTAQFVVDAAPVPPGNIGTSVDGQTRKVTVAWSANPEPDMVGYVVQRQLGAESWQDVTVTGKGTTSVVDGATASQGGTYRYRVFAVRESGTAGKGISSAPSATSSAKVPAPPVTTTTTTTTTAPDDEEPGGTTTDGTTGGSTDGSQRTSRTTTTRKPAPGPGASTGTSTSSGSPSAVLSTTGTVDLSGFARLLEQARSASETSPDTPVVEEEDGGFADLLPFGPRQRTIREEVEDGDDEATLVSAPIGDDGAGHLQSMAFLAGGLLATVLLMHVLLVRAELRRAEALEALVPEGPAPVAVHPGAESPTAAAPPSEAWGRHLATALARFHARPPSRTPAAPPVPDDDEEAERVVVG